ncbi:penicillin acylase family protein [Halobacteriovorax vibrionivorans]|uniref:Penicillin acylase family protein n=1 Tax=Halobacteriovorax vibrionivorans TaxID=2152716 RepID=A0ABY0IBT5_9BACT|nr:MULTISPECIES: penicillin acylase family protein [Halobacteriovorax]RZF20417.1 penicillin acylase family protein [Halobacteriovorax vibrionivorans]TGD46590.1 penicillin acylase family protein [Halobacteriovorax sp. Y22]
MKKIILSLLGAVFLLITTVYFLLLGSFPVMEGSLKIGDIDNEVQIYRDHEGVVHIDAKTRHDMNYALGFSMASDRAFQYELIARAGQGRLSEILGPDLVAADKLFRTLNSSYIRNDILTNLDPVVRKDLESFIAGYNYYLENSIRPIEYFILGIKPKKINLEDIYGVFVYLNYSFSPFMRNEIAYQQIMADVKHRDLKYLFANNEVDLSHRLRRVVEAQFIDYDDLLEGIGTFTGSNAWAISGDKTRSGKPILASDPHIKFSAPNIWYEANIKNEEEDFHMYGHFLPMIPFPGMGHNRNHGWGLTISYTDDVDLYQLDDDFYIVRVENSVIKVKGSTPINFNLKWSEKGPVVDEIVKTVNKDSKNIAAHFSFFQLGNKPIEGFYGLGRAKSFEEIKKATSIVKSPGLNIVYADAKGNVARLVMGDSYNRSHPFESDLVQSADRKILGAYDFDDKPHEINPENGFVVSANDAPKTIKEGIHHRGGWHSDNRYNTILESLKLRKNWDIDSQKMVQTASFSSHNATLLKLIGNAAKNSKLSQYESKALETLLSWKGHSRKDQVGPTIFHEMNIRIRKLLMDEMGDNYLNYCKAINSWTYYYRLLERPDDFWWDIEKTAPIEGRDDILMMAFKSTVSYLKGLLGDDISTWRWGRVHKLKFVHPFEKNKFLAKIFSHGPYEANGSINSINHIRRVKCNKGHTPVTGPSTRRLVDFANVDLSYGILPLGNSGHMLSPYYDNQRERFFNDEYRYQIFNFDLVKKSGPKVLTLRPI